MPLRRMRDGVLQQAHQHPNGMGWVSELAMVDPSAYVGPDAEVIQNAIVHAGCRIDGNSCIFGTADILEDCVVEGNTLVGAGRIGAHSTFTGSWYIVSSVAPNRHYHNGSAVNSYGDTEPIADQNRPKRKKILQLNYSTYEKGEI